MNGRDGLDYAGLCAYLRDVERMRPRDLVPAFRCLQAMETASLNVWAAQRAKNNPA